MDTKTQTPSETSDERYHDARTLQGLAEAERGEGFTEEEARERMSAYVKSRQS